MRWRFLSVLACVLACGLCAPPAMTQEPAPTPAPTEKNDKTGTEYLADGDKCLIAKDYPKALSNYLMAWLDMPENPAVIMRIGNVYLFSNQPAESVRFFRLAIKLNSAYEDPVNGLAQAYLKQNKGKEALDLLNDPQRLKLFGKSFRYLQEIGAAYLQQGKTREAIGKLNDAIKLAPDKGFLYGDLGNAYFISGKYSEAAEAYATAYKKTPTDPQPVFNRCLALEKLGKFADAAKALEDYLTLIKAPDDHPQRKHLTELKDKAGGR